MNELKRCPFCGGEAKICDGFIEEFLKTEYMKYVQCSYCKASTKLYFTEKEAIKAWNTRKPMEGIIERLEEESEKNRDKGFELERKEGMFHLADKFYSKCYAFMGAIKIVKEEGGIE